MLISAAITDGEREVMLFSDGGKVTRFKESDVRAMGRTARGVRGMRLPEGQKLISMLIPEEGSQILTASERGYGKRTAITEFLSTSVAARALSPWSATSVTAVWSARSRCSMARKSC